MKKLLKALWAELLLYTIAVLLLFLCMYQTNRVQKLEADLYQQRMENVSLYDENRMMRERVGE